MLRIVLTALVLTVSMTALMGCRAEAEIDPHNSVAPSISNLK